MKGVYILFCGEYLEGVYCDKYLADRKMKKLLNGGKINLKVVYKRIRWSD